ncbi:MAG: ATP-binding protein [Ilumatobacteraceae bacterium]
MKLSVRARLTIIVAAMVGALAAAAAVIAPSVVEDVLVDDILDAQAEEQQFLFQDDFFGGDFADLGFGGIDVGAFLADPLIAELVLAGDVDALIGLTGDDELIVALGANSFVAIDGDGSAEAFEADIATIDQPVLSIVEALKLEPFGDEFFGIGEEVFASGFPDEELVTGIRSVGGVEYIVFGDVASVQQTVDTVSDVLWLAVPILTVLAGLLAWLLAGRALRPVRSITDQAATISGGTLDARVPVPSTGDEVAVLATTVNEMLDRLETDDRRRRQFVSDASHELRSPVAVMKSEAEVALRDPETTDVEELASAVVVESGRMATIIDDLLALARHDEGLPAPTGVVDLDDIVLAEAQRSRRVPVDAGRVSAGRVQGRVDELTRMVGHLLDNAARHATTQVRVALQTTNHAVSLVVDDDGPGVPVDQRAVIFDRFTRLDEARTRDEGGAGLGLAVVTSIAERSGGNVVVGDSDLGGARFTLTWSVT